MMIVWRIDYQDPAQGNCVEWCQTRLRATELDGRVTQVVVPELKGPLVEWLNLHLNTDNG